MKSPVNLQPLPDETIFSLVSRFHLLSGNSREKDSYGTLFGCDRVRINSYLPSQLKATGSFFGLPPESLLWNHTLYPLFACFLTLKRASQLERAMLLNLGSIVGEKAGLPQSKLKFTTGHKHCPTCFAEDMSRIGVGYFRSTHQLPGVHACPIHAMQLICTTISDFSVDRSLILPRSGIGAIPAETHVARLAQFGASFVRQLQIRQQFPDYRRAYRIQLNKKGLLTKNGNVRMRMVTPALKAHWASLKTAHPYHLEFPDQLLAFDFVGPLLRERTHCPSHPIKHLLLAEWLFDGDAKLFWDANHEQQLILPGVQAPVPDTRLSFTDEFLHKREARRLSICNYMSSHPLAIRKEIKAAKNADFFWLYHNDKSWLEQQLPPPLRPKPTGKNWDSLDNQ